MIKDAIVDKHLVLTNDNKCNEKGHELISRACIHCGLTIHQISDINEGVLPLRDTPADRAEIRSLLNRDLNNAKDLVIKLEKRLLEIKDE